MLVFIGFEELFGVVELSFRFPQVFAGGVTLPFGEVLSAASIASVCHYAFDFEFFFVVNDSGRWLREAWSVRFVLFEAC